jgi:nucleoid-associated protein YgaU
MENMDRAKLPLPYTVKEGDQLPELCQQIYNDDSYYIQIAKYNGLDKFRDLTPRSQLIFPTIVSPKQSLENLSSTTS